MCHLRSSLRTRLLGQGNAMNSGDRAQRCLEGVSGWIREDVQRGGMGDKARMVGEGISYQAEGLYFGEIVQIQGF